MENRGSLIFDAWQRSVCRRMDNSAGAPAFHNLGNLDCQRLLRVTTLTTESLPTCKGGFNSAESATERGR